MPGKIRVMQVLEPMVGGTRRHLLDLCRHLPRDRFELHAVISLQRAGSHPADVEILRDLGVAVTVLPLAREISPAADWRGLRELIRLLRETRPHIIHGHSSKAGFLARLAARQVPGTATVYNPHGLAFQMQTSPARRWLYRYLERLAGRLTDRFVAAGDSQRDLALAAGIVPPERVVVIPNGIAPYSQPGDRAALRAAWGVGESTLVVGTIAALTPQKDVASLVRAAATVLRESPDVVFCVIGDGPERPALERLAQELGCGDGVRFLGDQPHAESLLPALDVFVLSSRWEGLPYVLLEAGSAGLPVVATRIPGNTDLISAGETGYLAAPGDPLDLAVNLLAALRDPDRAARGMALRDLVQREYTLDRMIAGHAALYEELANPTD